MDSVEPILFVPSIRGTTEWYKKYLNWCSGDADDNEKWGHAAICPYSDESAEPQYRNFKGFHLRQAEGAKIEGCGFFVFVSGLESLRDAIIEAGWDNVGEIYHQCWGIKVFELTDLNGFYIEFCEWDAYSRECGHGFLGYRARICMGMLMCIVWAASVLFAAFFTLRFILSMLVFYLYLWTERKE